MFTFSSMQKTPAPTTQVFTFHSLPETLDQIQRRLSELGLLAPLREHEPVDFWNTEES